MLSEDQGGHIRRSSLHTASDTLATEEGTQCAPDPPGKACVWHTRSHTRRVCPTGLPRAGGDLVAAWATLEEGWSRATCHKHTHAPHGPRAAGPCKALVTFTHSPWAAGCTRLRASHRTPASLLTPGGERRVALRGTGGPGRRTNSPRPQRPARDWHPAVRAPSPGWLPLGSALPSRPLPGPLGGAGRVAEGRPLTCRRTG